MPMPIVYNLGSNSTGLIGLMLQSNPTGLWVPQHSATWADMSPSGNTGTASNVTYSGAAPFARMPIVPAVFNGSTAVVNCGSAASLDNLAALTFIFWGTVAGLGGSGGGRLVNKGGNGLGGVLWTVNDSSGLTGTTTGLQFIVGHATTPLQVRTKNSCYSLNQQVMLATTWTGGTATSTVKTYSSTSGALAEITMGVTSDTAGVGARTDDAANDFMLGNRPDAARAYNGTYSLFAVFPSVLSFDTLQSFYLVGVNGP